MQTIRIGTRKSQLALWQANYVRDQLLKCHQDLNVVLVEIVSAGDKTLDVPLSQVGGKGLFLKELEQALLQDKIDLAVHSMKDVTVSLPDGLDISVICPREDPRDAFVSNRFERVDLLPEGAVVGTCSLRRQCQIRARFPHLQLDNLRGNVNTRLSRLDQGDFDGIVLAAAGLKRLQFEHRIAEYLEPEICLPAVGQGAVGIECRVDDTAVMALIKPLNHTDTATRVMAERAANERLGGGCHVPVAVYSELKQGTINIRALVGNLDGSRFLRAEKNGSQADAIGIGYAVADDLLAQGAGEILAQIYEQ